MGANDSKIGITGHPLSRLGVYQNSYSRNSHIAQFDRLYLGGVNPISKLEKAVKDLFHWDIGRDGWGVSEWIDNWTVDMIETEIDKIIKGYKFKIEKVDPKFLPLNSDNMQDFLQHYNLI